MDDGISGYRSASPWSPSSVKAALTAALSRATRLQAGIGYWTIDSGLLGPDLVRAIRHESEPVEVPNISADSCNVSPSPTRNFACGPKPLSRSSACAKQRNASDRPMTRIQRVSSDSVVKRTPLIGR